MRQFAEGRLQQRTELVLGEARIPDDAAHREGVRRVVPWDGDDPDAIAHDDMLTLPDGPKASLLKGPHGVLMVDACDSRHFYVATSISRTKAPSNSSSRAARYS